MRKLSGGLCGLVLSLFVFGCGGDGGGGGVTAADALATCIVIEEIARVCTSSSLIPAVNKLGSMPLVIGANDDVKTRYLTPLG